MVFYSSCLAGAGFMGSAALLVPSDGFSFSGSSSLGSYALFFLNFILGAIVGVYSDSPFGSYLLLSALTAVLYSSVLSELLYLFFLITKGFLFSSSLGDSYGFEIMFGVLVFLSSVCWFFHTLSSGFSSALSFFLKREGRLMLLSSCTF